MVSTSSSFDFMIVSSETLTGLCRTWELLTWLLGTAFVLIIIALLASFHGKPISHWKSSISINTIVSVLSQAAVSALLFSVSGCIGQMKWIWYQNSRRLDDLHYFDLASRGPEGSLRFLTNRHRFL